MPGLHNDIDFVDKILNKRFVDILPSEYAEKHRYMTSDVSAWEGYFDYDRTPYLREIINRLSENDPAHTIAVIKGAQIGYTAGVIENGIPWIIANNPGNILFMCADKDLTKEVVDKRIEQAIDSCGIRHLIGPNVKKKRNNKTGDTSMHKEFAGGSLIADGVNNANKLRNRSVQYGFIDDFDSAKQNDAKEGSFRRRLEMRFSSYAWKKKLFYISTPTIKGQSNIEEVYNLGDKRRYHVPCPKCGDYIIIEWRVDKGDNNFAGIHFELDQQGKLKESSVGYVCQSCGGFFTEKNKRDLLINGQWVSTADPSEDGYFSYHIPSLYAPPGMYNWTYYVRQFLECYPNGFGQKAKVGNLKTFLNTCLGQTYEEKGKEIKINQLATNTRNYKIGTVPSELSEADGNGKIIMLTCSCDLNGFVDDARIDYEVLAHTETGSTYSIDAGSIGTFQRGLSPERREVWTYRNNEHVNNVWPVFLEKILQKTYYDDSNNPMHILSTGIDTGNFTQYAYTFVDENQYQSIPLMIIGLKGDANKLRKHGVDTSYYHKSKERDNLYILEVNQLKDSISDKVELVWQENSRLSQPAGFMNFPVPEDNKYTYKDYFKHYEAEQKVPKLNADGSEVGYTWQKKHSSVANHFFDCAIYQPAIRDIFVENFLKAGKYKDLSWGKFCEVMKQI